MTCDDMLALLLEAEREELEGLGGSVVAAHLRDCARCRSVASMLLAETTMLAAHVEAGRPAPDHGRSPRVWRNRTTARPVMWGGALAAAAVVALVFVPTRQPQRTVMLVAPAITPVSPGPTTSGTTSGTTSATTSGTTSGTTSRTTVGTAGRRPVPVQAIRFPDVVAATPLPFVASQSVEPLMPPSDSSGVSVMPPSGTRSAVLATRNPKITVVWLY